MEIPEINMISDFEAGMNCLQNPSLISQKFSLSGIGKFSQIYSFCTWGALILAIVTIINRIKLLIVRNLYRFKSLASAETLLQSLTDDCDFTDDDSISSDVSEDDDECTSTSSFEDGEPVDEDFRVTGSSYYRDDQGLNCNFGLRRRRGSVDRFSWSDFAAGKSVVKLWDSFGLGFDCEDSSDSESVVSMWDLNKEQKIGSIFGGGCQIPAIYMPSPAVVLSAGINRSGNVVVGAIDNRVGGKIPSMRGEWRRKSPEGSSVGIKSGGVKKVYVRDDVTGDLTVGDMRNVMTPLECLSESDGDTWWDADAVIVSDQFVE